VLYAGRVVAGLAIGVLCATVPLFNSELAPAEIRGRLISFNQIAMTGGILVAFWINFALQDYENGWRYALAGQCVPALLLLVSCLWIPRSPRWLVQQGLIDEARLTLVMLRPGKTIDEVHGELAAIESSVMEDKHNDSWSHLLTDLGSRRRLLVGMGMQSGQNLTGINAIMYYAPSIFQSCGFSGGLLAQGINGWVNFLATLWAFKVVDDYGRRQLLLWGAAVMGGAMALLGGLGLGFAKEDPDDSSKVTMDNKVIGMCCIVLVYIFVAGFAVSWGPVCWLLPTEMFPLQQRARCVSITTGSNFFWNILVGLFTPILLDNIHWWVMIIFAACCAWNFGLTYFTLPETKGLALERVAELFDPTSPRYQAPSETKPEATTPARPPGASVLDSA